MFILGDLLKGAPVSLFYRVVWSGRSDGSWDGGTGLTWRRGDVRRAGDGGRWARGRPRGRLPGLGGNLQFARDVMALRALGTSLTPRFICPRSTASGNLYRRNLVTAM